MGGRNVNALRILMRVGNGKRAGDTTLLIPLNLGTILDDEGMPGTIQLTDRSLLMASLEDFKDYHGQGSECQ